MHSFSPRSTSSTIHSANQRNLNLRDKLHKVSPSASFSSRFQPRDSNSTMSRTQTPSFHQIDIKKGLVGGGGLTDNTFKSSLRSYPLNASRSPSIISNSSRVKEPVKILRTNYASSTRNPQDILGSARYSSTQTNTCSGEMPSGRYSKGRRYGTSRDFGSELIARTQESPVRYETQRDYAFEKCLITEESETSATGADLNEKLRNIFNFAETSSKLEESFTDFNVGETTPSVAEEKKTCFSISVNKTNLHSSRLRK